MATVLTVTLEGAPAEAFERVKQKTGWDAARVLQYGLKMAALRVHDVSGDFAFGSENSVAVVEQSVTPEASPIPEPVPEAAPPTPEASPAVE